MPRRLTPAEWLQMEMMMTVDAKAELEALMAQLRSDIERELIEYEAQHPELSDVKVVGWTSYECDLPDAPETHWHDDALVSEIREKGWRFSGNEHQYAEAGAPVFSDGTVGRYSMREWGGIMADALGITGDMAYCEWAWHSTECVMPDAVWEADYDR